MLTILHIDDDEADRQLFAMAVKRARNTAVVHGVAGAAEAISYLDGDEGFANRSRYPLPDVIILDLVMPKMSGADFLKWRNRSAFLLPVVILTGSSDRNDIDEAEWLGALMTIPKSDNPERLQQMLAELCDVLEPEKK